MPSVPQITQAIAESARRAALSQQATRQAAAEAAKAKATGGTEPATQQEGGQK